jgi:hypothetical protein
MLKTQTLERRFSQIPADIVSQVSRFARVSGEPVGIVFHESCIMHRVYFLRGNFFILCFGFVSCLEFRIFHTVGV